jgi:hypothetical protein
MALPYFPDADLPEILFPGTVVSLIGYSVDSPEILFLFPYCPGLDNFWSVATRIEYADCKTSEPSP